MDTKQLPKVYPCFQSKSFTVTTRRPEPVRPKAIGTKRLGNCLGNYVIVHQKQQ